MGNPFKKLGGVVKAAKVGYTILKKYEALEAIGIVPDLKINGISVTTFDQAASTLVTTLKAEHDRAKGDAQQGE